MNRRTALAIGTAAVVLVSIAIVTSRLTGSVSPHAETTDMIDAMQSAVVQRGDLSSEREFKAVLSFGERWAINTAATGTITRQHPVGKVVHFGESILHLDNKPVTLAMGTMPMYRDLYQVNTRSRDAAGDRLKLLTGVDVSQLQAFLLDAGFDADGHLRVDGEFGGHTKTAVENWQESLELAVTGSVDNSQIVFAPGQLRIATASRVGAAFTGLEVNSAEAAILVETTNRDRAALPVGAEVSIELPDGEEMIGTVTKQEQVTSTDGSPVWRTTIKTEGQLPGTAGSATVTVIEVVAQDVLLVPTGALLAVAEGGFAVEVITGSGTELVAVDVGDVLDQQAEITGNVATGDKVVIPS